MFNQTTVVFALLIFGTITVGAGPLKKSASQLDVKIIEAEARLESLQADPTKAIPAVIIQNARGIIILRQLKVGLGFGGEAGGGVALVRRDDGTWSSPAFVGVVNASWGAQIGAQDKDVVMLLMNDEALNLLRKGNQADIGAEYEATVGPVNIEADIDTKKLSPILIYSNAKGGFAGVSLKAGGIIGAKIKNQTYYAMSIQEILFSGPEPFSNSAKNLIKAIQENAKHL